MGSCLKVNPGVDRDRPRRGLAGGAGAGRNGRAGRLGYAAPDASERGGIDIHVWIAPLRVVQGVDQIGPKRERHAFTNLRSLGHPQIDQEVAGTLQIAQAQRTNFAWRGIGQQYLAGAIDNDTVGVDGFQIPGVGTEIRWRCCRRGQTGEELDEPIPFLEFAQVFGNRTNRIRDAQDPGPAHRQDGTRQVHWSA